MCPPASSIAPVSKLEEHFTNEAICKFLMQLKNGCSISLEKLLSDVDPYEEMLRYHPTGDFLELDDLAIPLSPSANCTTMTSEEYFDSEALMCELGDDNGSQQIQESKVNPNISVPAKLKQVVLGSLDSDKEHKPRTRQTSKTGPTSINEPGYKPYFQKVDLLSASFRVDSLTICFDKNPLSEIPNIIFPPFLSPFKRLLIQQIAILIAFRKQFFSSGIMIKLFKVKEKQRELAENSNGKPPVKKQSAGELRLHKDISELNLPKTCNISFPNGKDDLMNFEVTIRPDDGYYLGGTFTFTFQISSIYPHEAPKVKCKTKVYHPNIDLDGNVCLNILREDWKPVLNINTIIYGLYHLFTEPNHDDPLNREAAAVLRDNPKMFESNVRRAMAGGYVGQTFFTRCI
ncbi:hypothetical protein L1887_11499 [Cichorium endivia]|nr:hypothetical protein L1887_11499 [Cichorium endivia]